MVEWEKGSVKYLVSNLRMTRLGYRWQKSLYKRLSYSKLLNSWLCSEPQTIQSKTLMQIIHHKTKRADRGFFH